MTEHGRIARGNAARAVNHTDLAALFDRAHRGLHSGYSEIRIPRHTNEGFQEIGAIAWWEKDYCTEGERGTGHPARTLVDPIAERYSVQVNYAEPYESAERRFRPWLEESLVNALTLWRKSL